MKILMTGATGLVGKALGTALVKKGHQIVVVSRRTEGVRELLPFPCDVLTGDLSEGPLSQAPVVEGIIHLMGESVAEGRWNEAKKKRIVTSRLNATQNLLESFKGSSQKPTVFVMASAIGFYGDRGEEDLHEDSKLGAGFLADVCRDWERAGDLASTDMRKVALRIGLVLARTGGALQKMLPAFQMGFGGELGSGKQWMSWIHLEDLVQQFIWALENSKASGVYNAISPQPVRNSDFTKVLAKHLEVKSGPSAPAALLRMVLGEVAAVVLASQKVAPSRIVKEGFQFKFADLDAALSDLCRGMQGGVQIFETEQYFPVSRPKVFPFFADASNLEKITPELLKFKITKMEPAEIKTGTLIDYRLRVHGFPIRWRTLIEDWEPPTRFSDQQMKGPYALWHHTHEFSDLAEGTWMKDIVRYKVPMGKLGLIAGGWLVASDVQQIFAYRRKAVAKYITDIK